MERFKIIRPKSLVNSDYEQFEYLLRWIGRDGSDHVYMFYDAEIQHKIKNDVINQEDAARIQSVSITEGRNITLQADDLSKNDLLVISELFSNTQITRLLKNGTIQKFAPDSNSFKYELRKGRYSVEFTLIMPDLKTWK